jgi:phage terminase large subunit
MDFTLLHSDYNDNFYRYLFEVDRPIEVLFGSGGSSKSVHAAIKAILKVRFRNRNILVLRQRANSIRESFFSELKKAADRLGLYEDFTFYKGTLLIVCKANGNSILFRGLDDVEKVKSITPAKGDIDDVIWEECTESDEEAMYQLMVRQRGGGEKIDGKKLFEMREAIDSGVPWSGAIQAVDSLKSTGKTMTFLFNPIYENHWVNRVLFKQLNVPTNIFDTKEYISDQCYVMHSTHWDNQFLTYEDHLKYESFKTKSPYFYQVYALGRWGILDGVIFTNWRVEDFARSRKFDNVRFGVDFGFTNDPTVFYSIAIEGMKIYIFNEVYEIGLSNKDLSDIIKPITGNGTVWCDCAEPKTISDLKTRGVKAIGVSKSFSKSYRLQLMQQYEIIFDTNCKYGPEEFSRYLWNKNKYGMKSNEPEDRNDHSADAIYYGIEKYLEQKYGDKGRIR